MLMFSLLELLKARQQGAAPRRWKDGKLHAKRGGKWVIVSEDRARENLRSKKKLVSRVAKPSEIQAQKKATMQGLNDYVRTKYGRDIEMKMMSGYVFFSLSGLKVGKYPLPVKGTLSGSTQGEWEKKIDASMKKAGMFPMGMKEAIQSILVPPIADRMPDPVKIDAKTRAKLNHAVSKAVPENYYDAIPLGQINDALKSEGYILIQEDNTEWSGFLLGDSSETIFHIGELNTVVSLNGIHTYAEVENSGLLLTWYKMDSGRYEIVKYIT